MKRIHFNVSIEKENALYQAMDELKIYEADIQEVFLSSGKKGGQNANRVNTKVQLTHSITGLQVQCNSSRSQLLNRFLARRLLIKKIIQLQNGEQNDWKKKRKQKDRNHRRQRRQTTE